MSEPGEGVTFDTYYPRSHVERLERRVERLEAALRSDIAMLARAKVAFDNLVELALIPARIEKKQRAWQRTVLKQLLYHAQHSRRRPPMRDQPKYAIINEFDAPEPNMVVQWVPIIGYCYMDRTKSSFDGMQGKEATCITAFGFRVAEDSDGYARFYMSDIPATAIYSDGVRRPWQSKQTYFERRMLKRSTKAEPVETPDA